MCRFADKSPPGYRRKTKCLYTWAVEQMVNAASVKGARIVMSDLTCSTEAVPRVDDY